MDSVIDPSETDTRLSDVLRGFRGMLGRRWKTLAIVFVVAAGLGLGLVALRTPKYEAIARVRIDPSRSPGTTVGEDQTSLGSEAIETEVAVLNSPELAREVVKRANLQTDPEFSRGTTGSDGTPQAIGDRLNRVTAEVMRHLAVGRDKLTYIIAVKFVSRDAAKAASIANAFANTYIETRVDARIGTAARQGEFYRRQLAVASAELNAAQQRVGQYRAATGIVQSGAGGTITDQQVAPLSSQLATAEAAAAEARSNLSVARSQIANGGLDAVSAVRSSTVISDLRRQRAEVERNRGEIEARYGPRFPESIKVHDQLNALDKQIRDEAERAIGSLQAESSAADAQVASLRATLRTLRGQQAGDTRAAATAASLDQDVANKKQAYDRLAQQAQETTQSQRNSIAQAEIVDRAVTPTAPAPPSRTVLAILALVIAGALGTAAAIIQEMLSSGLRTTNDMEGRLGLPLLASIPRVARRMGPPDASLLSDRTSMYAESIRNARSSIVGVKGNASCKVIAITSAIPGEGKSTAALSLARVSAMAGSATLLVECDVRRAQLGRMTGITSSTGLVEVLRREATVDQAIAHDQVALLDLLLVAKPYFTSEDLFGDGRLAALLDKFRGSYKLIVLDLPPVLGLADARTIAAQADDVVLAIRWGKTPVPAVEQVLASLRADGAHVTGALFTMVDPKAEAMGGMYFSGKYAGYYAQPA